MSKSIKLKNNVYLDDISLRRNIIFCNPSADVTIPANSYTTIDNLSAYYIIGSKLSISNGKIKIGKNVSYIKLIADIGLNCQEDTLYSYAIKNNNTIGFWLVKYVKGAYDCTHREEIIPVSENDLITINVYLANGGSVASGNRTKIIAEVIN